MATPKADYLRECMNDVGQAPIDVFQKAFCVVCANRECARSSANNLAFDRRVLNWKKDLFDNVPRAADDDPRFAQIRAKRFIVRDPSAPNVVARPTQIDPVLSPQPEPEQPKAEAHSVEPVPAPPEPSPAPPEPEVAPKPVVTTGGQSNTPFAQGTVIPGYKPEKVEDTVLEPGDSFTFGGGGEENE